MGATPIGETPIAFALIVRKGGVDFIEASICYLGGFDGTARFATQRPKRIKRIARGRGDLHVVTELFQLADAADRDAVAFE